MNEEKEKLSVEMLEEISKDFSETKDVKIYVETKDGIKETSASINVRFNSLKVSECVKEYISKLDYIKMYVKNEKKLADVLRVFLIFMIVKHFSSLEIPFQFKRQVAVLEKMMDSQILMQIFSHYETKEVEKIMLELKKVIGIADKNFYKMEDSLKELSEMHKKNSNELAKNLKKKG